MLDYVPQPILQVFAPLQIVPTANYVRFGPAGVRRFGPTAPANPPPHPHTITVELTLKDHTGAVLFSYPSLMLRTARLDLEDQTVWEGRLEEEGLHVIWVWDFYRLFSGTAVSLSAKANSRRAESPYSQSRPSPSQIAVSQAVAALQHAPVGSKLILAARSLSGDILQVYPID